MKRPMLPLTDLSRNEADPVLVQVVRFARDVAWRHRNLAAEPARFRAAFEGYYRAWRITNTGAVPPLDTRVLWIAIAAYRDAHRTLQGSRRSNEHSAA
jgi:hypothetical protein